MNLIDELGDLAISTRLMRLSELWRKDVTRIYEEHHLDFKSKWFPVLYVLSKRSPLSVIELTDEIGYAAPSVIALVKEMEKEKLVKSIADKKDGRKRMLSLTPKAMSMIDEFKPLWDDFRTINKTICDEGGLLKAIESAEAALKEHSFYERYKERESKRTH